LCHALPVFGEAPALGDFNGPALLEAAGLRHLSLAKDDLLPLQ
jgi:hypothetical protein